MVVLSNKKNYTDYSPEEIDFICKGAMLHDLGKLDVKNVILTKERRLTDEEMEIMKEHTTKGYRIAMASAELEPIAEYIKAHHEKWNGTGYPSGLKGEEIPLLSRMIAIVDSFDVMTHDRPYHKAMPVELAKLEIIRCAGSHFDPYIADIFVKMIDTSNIEELEKMEEKKPTKDEADEKKL